MEYHQSIGFEDIFLFNDGASDAGVDAVRGRRGVHVFDRGVSLDDRWRRLPAFSACERFLGKEVMARQILNAELGVIEARERGLEWLLHIDADELLFTNGTSAPEHYERLSRAGVTEVVYVNHEAVPEEEEIEDFFRDVTLFKTSPKYLPGLGGGPGYIAYTSGKAAARLDTLPRPFGVHRFRSTTGAHRSVLSKAAQILHYPSCGYSRFVAKYEILGQFDDAWFGALGIAEHMPFHARARDVVAARDHDELRRMYRRCVMLSDADEAQRRRWMETRQLQRITGPACILRAAGPAMPAMRGEAAAS